MSSTKRPAYRTAVEIVATRNLDRRALTVTEFCAAHGVSRAMFYLLVEQGLAPRSFKVGARRLISIEAADDWRRAREAASAADRHQAAGSVQRVEVA